MVSHARVEAPRATVPEDKDTRLLRQIRNWVAFIGIVIAIGLAGSIVTGIVIGVNAAHSSSASSNCLSQGGTDSSC